MILNSPYITGSLTVTGNANIQGALTVTGSLSGTAATSSFALTLQGTGSVGFATTGAFSATSGSASSRLTQIEQVYATTGSNSFRANQSITGSLTVTGQIIAQTLNVQQVTSSIVYSSGSNVFGCDINSRQVFTGSFYQTGSIAVFSNNIGIGIANPGVSLDANGYAKFIGIGINASPTSIGANPNYVRLTNTGGDLYIGQEGSTNGAFFNGSLAYNSVLYSGRPINFIIDGVSRTYINSSGNVAIGSTNPTYRLDIQSGSDFDIRLRDTSLGGTVGILFETANDFSGTSQAYIKGIGSGNSGLSDLILGTAGTSGATCATERMRITSAGNVGIGVTPSAWTTLTPLQIKNVAFAGYTSGNTHVLYAASNFYYNDGDKYITNGHASLYSQADGSHSWYTGGCNISGAGSSLTFTERLKLTNTGTLFHKGYVGANLMGGFSVIGTISAINTGDRYLHARINTLSTMMYWIKVFGYNYVNGVIEGLSGGYIGGGTGAVNQGAQNGSIVAQYQNNGYLEVVVDTIGTGTTNRWGSITFLGGSDTITTVQPLEIMTYSWTSTTTRVY